MDFSVKHQTRDNTEKTSDDEKTKLIFGKHQNVLLNENEKTELLTSFGEADFKKELESYSIWKKENDAKPRSDFESLKKWLNKKRQKGTYKTNTTAVKETGVDEVSQETLDNLPF